MRKFVFAIYFKESYYATIYYEAVAESMAKAFELVKKDVKRSFKVRNIEERPVYRADKPNTVTITSY